MSQLIWYFVNIVLWVGQAYTSNQSKIIEGAQKAMHTILTSRSGDLSSKISFCSPAIWELATVHFSNLFGPFCEYGMSASQLSQILGDEGAALGDFEARFERLVTTKCFSNFKRWGEFFKLTKWNEKFNIPLVGLRYWMELPIHVLSCLMGMQQRYTGFTVPPDGTQKSIQSLMRGGGSYMKPRNKFWYMFDYYCINFLSKTRNLDVLLDFYEEIQRNTLPTDVDRIVWFIRSRLILIELLKSIDPSDDPKEPRRKVKCFMKLFEKEAALLQNELLASEFKTPGRFLYLLASFDDTKAQILPEPSLVYQELEQELAFLGEDQANLLIGEFSRTTTEPPKAANMVYRILRCNLLMIVSNNLQAQNLDILTEKLLNLALSPIDVTVNDPDLHQILRLWPVSESSAVKVISELPFPISFCNLKEGYLFADKFTSRTYGLMLKKYTTPEVPLTPLDLTGLWNAPVDFRQIFLLSIPATKNITSFFFHPDFEVITGIPSTLPVGNRRRWMDSLFKAFMDPQNMFLIPLNNDNKEFKFHWGVSSSIGSLAGRLLGKAFQLRLAPLFSLHGEFWKMFVETKFIKGRAESYFEDTYREDFEKLKEKFLTIMKKDGFVGVRMHHFLESTTFDQIGNFMEANQNDEIEGERFVRIRTEDDLTVYMSKVVYHCRGAFLAFMSNFRIDIGYFLKTRNLEFYREWRTLADFFKGMKLTAETLMSRISLINSDSKVQSLLVGRKIALKKVIYSIILAMSEEELVRLLETATKFGSLHFEDRVVFSLNFVTPTSTNVFLKGEAYFLFPPSSPLQANTIGDLVSARRFYKPFDIQQIHDHEMGIGGMTSKRYIQLFRDIALQQANLMEAEFQDPFKEDYPMFWDGPLMPCACDPDRRIITLTPGHSAAIIHQILSLLYPQKL